MAFGRRGSQRIWKHDKAWMHHYCCSEDVRAKCKDREKPLGVESNPLSKASKEMGK